MGVQGERRVGLAGRRERLGPVKNRKEKRWAVRAESGLPLRPRGGCASRERAACLVADALWRVRAVRGCLRRASQGERGADLERRRRVGWVGRGDDKPCVQRARRGRSQLTSQKQEGTRARRALAAGFAVARSELVLLTVVGVRLHCERQLEPKVVGAAAIRPAPGRSRAGQGGSTITTQRCTATLSAAGLKTPARLALPLPRAWRRVTAPPAAAAQASLRDASEGPLRGPGQVLALAHADGGAPRRGVPAGGQRQLGGGGPGFVHTVDLHCRPAEPPAHRGGGCGRRPADARVRMVQRTGLQRTGSTASSSHDDSAVQM